MLKNIKLIHVNAVHSPRIDGCRVHERRGEHNTARWAEGMLDDLPVEVVRRQLVPRSLRELEELTGDIAIHIQRIGKRCNECLRVLRRLTC